MKEIPFLPQPKPQKQEKPKQRTNSLQRKPKSSQASKSQKKAKSHLRAWLNSSTPVASSSTKQSRKEKGRITPETRTDVLVRDGFKCVKCGRKQGETGAFKGVPYFIRLEIHHITFRSGLGEGTKRNLATVCGPVTQSGTCHHWAQNTREGRVWFENWREERLDDNGDYKTA